MVHSSTKDGAQVTHVIEGQLDTFQLEMLGRHDVPGLMPFDLQQDQLVLDVTNKCTLTDYLRAHTLTVNQFKRLLEQFLSIMEDSVLYYLDRQNYLIDAEKIYVTRNLSALWLIYEPVLTQDSQVNPLYDFLYKVLLPNMKFNLEEDWSFFLSGLSTYNSMAHQPINTFNPYEVFHLYDKDEPGGHITEDLKAVSQSPAPSKIEAVIKAKTPLKEIIKGLIKKEEPFQEEDAPVAEGTVLLRRQSTAVKLIPRLTRYPTILLEKSAIIIGRHKQSADVVIRQGTIGKLHAEIITETDGIYLRDLNSLNGTFINDLKLCPYEIKPIQVGDSIRFSAVEYEVCGDGN